MKPFVTQLAPKKSGIVGGYAAGEVDPSKVADDLFKAEVPGPWLCCYMIRRFGWPNRGSDDYKQLCSWLVTTPMRGLFLGITPYLGNAMNLHFSIGFTKAVQAGIRRDPGRESFFARKEKAVRRWWKTTGRKLYVWGTGKKVGDEDELVKAAGDRNGDEVFGLWKRTLANGHERGRSAFSPGGAKEAHMATWFLGDFIKEKHPEVKLPRMTKRERDRRKTAFHRKVEHALRATMRDLLRPTHVRDISFTPFGDIERTPEAVARYSKQEDTGFFEGAGYAPSYWYNPKNQAAIRKAKR